MDDHTPVDGRYWPRVDVRGPDECWPWIGARNRKGYGKLPWGDGTGISRVAHRYGYELANGPIPVGMLVLHRCDNPPCQNPAHLFLGTASDNTNDMISKGRQSHGERSPLSVLSDADVMAILAARATGRLQREIAADFGVTQSHISRICNGLMRASGSGQRNLPRPHRRP